MRTLNQILLSDNEDTLEEKIQHERVMLAHIIDDEELAYRLDTLKTLEAELELLRRWLYPEIPIPAYIIDKLGLL